MASAEACPAGIQQLQLPQHLTLSGFHGWARDPYINSENLHGEGDTIFSEAPSQRSVASAKVFIDPGLVPKDTFTGPSSGLKYADMRCLMHPENARN